MFPPSIGMFQIKTPWPEFIDKEGRVLDDVQKKSVILKVERRINERGINRNSQYMQRQLHNDCILQILIGSLYAESFRSEEESEFSKSLNILWFNVL